MAEIWNLWDVKPPPVCTVKTELHCKEMNDLSQVSYDALKSLKNLSYFDREAAILSRFLYKYKRIFRHDKGIQNLVKVDQCLKRYLKLNMLEVIFTFKQSIPFNIKSVSTHIYFPTRQMLKWVLLRLQAFSQIFVRLIELTKAAGSYMYKKLCLGWSLHNSLFIFCIIARILVTSKYLVAKSIEWYSSLYKYLPYLRETSDYLPGYNFPGDLKMWLGKVDLTPITKAFVDDFFEFIDLVKEDEEEYEDDSEKLIKKEFLRTLFEEVQDATSDPEEIKVEETEKNSEAKQPLQTSLLCEDLGVSVEDNGEEISAKKGKKRTFNDLVPVKGNKKRIEKRTANRKNIFIDLVLAEDGKKEALNEIKKRKELEERRFTDLVPVEGNQKRSDKGIRKRKNIFIDLVEDGKEEALKETKKRKKLKKKTFIDLVSMEDGTKKTEKVINKRKNIFVDLVSVEDNGDEAPKKKRKRMKKRKKKRNEITLGNEKGVQSLNKGLC